MRTQTHSSINHLLFAGCLLLVGCQPNNQPDEQSNRGTTSAHTESRPATSMRTDGRVVFMSKQTGSVLAQVSVQIADSEEERSAGLMYRAYLPDSTGMLFIFDDSSPRSFWMKNTAISLDIIFANAEKEIVKIHAYTIPYAIDSYPSEQGAQYVVEVNGGYCEKHSIRAGDRLQFDFIRP